MPIADHEDANETAHDPRELRDIMFSAWLALLTTTRSLKRRYHTQVVVQTLPPPSQRQKQRNIAFLPFSFSPFFFLLLFFSFLF